MEIGDAIEDIYKDELHEHYEALAEHYVTGENHEKGAEYCRLAGRKAEHAGSLNEAIPYGERRVACLERLPRTEQREKRIIDARTTLGLYCMQMSWNVEAKEAVEPIVELALERNYKRRVSQIYTIIGAYSDMVEEDFPKALKYLEDALKIAEEINDVVSLFMARHWLGCALSHACEFEKGLYNFKKGLEINVAANSLWGIAQVKSVMVLFVHVYVGKIDLAYQTSDEALQVAEESGDIMSKRDTRILPLVLLAGTRGSLKRQRGTS